MKLRESNPNNYNPDSHTSIADYHGYKGAAEDKLNKYEYCPFTKKFTIDQINGEDDSNRVKKFLDNYDFTDILNTIQNLNLSSLQALPKGLVFPKGIQNLNLSSLQALPKGLVFPKGIQYLNLNSLQALPKGFTKFPEGIQYLYLNSDLKRKYNI